MIPEAVFNTLVYGWIAMAIIIFPVLLRVTAPYGRHTTTKWGPTLPSHWGWFIMELPVVVVFSVLFFYGPVEKNLVVYILFGSFMIHYFNRVFIFPFRRKSNDKKMPWSIVGLAFLFNLCNGFFNGYWFGFLSHSYTLDWLVDPRFIAGAVLFLLGMLINQQSDRALLNLRKGGKKGYFIPRGGLFNYISSPNLFGEIIEWIGWALMCWCLPALAFAIWTMANLIPRALDHHRWYHNRFEDYPKERKAIFPHLL